MPCREPGFPILPLNLAVVGAMGVNLDRFWALQSAGLHREEI